MAINLDFIIGKAVEEPVHKNVYLLVAEYMHGDADGDTTKEEFYSPSELDDLKLSVIGLMAVEDRDSVEDDVIAAFEQHGVEGDMDELFEGFSDNWYESDMTCEGEWASVTGVTVFYFDENGVKHTVSWK